MYQIQWRIQDFSEVGAPTLQGAPTYHFAKFSPKLHKIERIWTPGARPLRPLKSANEIICTDLQILEACLCPCTAAELHLIFYPVVVR